jgi:hypothetical protein
MNSEYFQQLTLEQEKKYWFVFYGLTFTSKTDASFRCRHVLNSFLLGFFVGRKMDAWTTKINQNER